MINKLKLVPDTQNTINTIIFDYYCDKDAISDLACSLMVKILQESLYDKSKVIDLIKLYPAMVSLVVNLPVQDVIHIIKAEPSTIFYIEDDDMRIEYIKSFLDFGYGYEYDYILKDIKLPHDIDEETALRIAIIDIDLLNDYKSMEWYVDVIRLANLELT